MRLENSSANNHFYNLKEKEELFIQMLLKIRLTFVYMLKEKSSNAYGQSIYYT